MTPVAQSMRAFRALRLGLVVALFMAVALSVTAYAAADAKDAKDAKKADAKADAKGAATNAPPKELPIPVSMFKDEKKASGEPIGTDPFFPQSIRRFPPPKVVPIQPGQNQNQGTSATNAVPSQVPVEPPKLSKQLKAKASLGTRLAIISGPFKNYTLAVGEAQTMAGEGIKAKVTLKAVKPDALVVEIEGEGTKELPLVTK